MEYHPGGWVSIQKMQGTFSIDTLTSILNSCKSLRGTMLDNNLQSMEIRQ